MWARVRTFLREFWWILVLIGGVIAGARGGAGEALKARRAAANARKREVDAVGRVDAIEAEGRVRDASDASENRIADEDGRVDREVADRIDGGRDSIVDDAINGG